MEKVFMTLVKPSTREFIHIIGNGEKGTNKTPHILSPLASKQAINSIYPSFDWNDCELVEIRCEIIEIG